MSNSVDTNPFSVFALAQQKGTSLVEVLIAMTIILISVAGFLTTIKDAMRIESTLREREREVKLEVGEKIEELQLYFAEQGAKSY